MQEGGGGGIWLCENIHQFLRFFTLTHRASESQLSHREAIYIHLAAKKKKKKTENKNKKEKFYFLYAPKANCRDSEVVLNYK